MINITDEKIIEMYKKGLSVDYISKLLYKDYNKNQKPVTLNGTVLFPAKIYKKDFCKKHVYEVIYSNLLHNCLSRFSK